MAALVSSHDHVSGLCGRFGIVSDHASHDMCGPGPGRPFNYASRFAGRFRMGHGTTCSGPAHCRLDYQD